jgi:hypothetical protein
VSEPLALTLAELAHSADLGASRVALDNKTMSAEESHVISCSMDKRSVSRALSGKRCAGLSTFDCKVHQFVALGGQILDFGQTLANVSDLQIG